MNEPLLLSEFPARTEVAVVGAGAAGLMAAIFAARAGASVHLFDGAKKVGAKILVSGGSRCNVTNEAIAPARFHGEGAPAFVARVLRAYSPDQTRRFFEEIGVPLKLEPTGKFFPVSDSSRQVLGALLHTAHRAGAVLHSATDVCSLARAEDGDGWIIETSRGVVHARAVIMATGGLALPKSGSNGRGFQFARALGTLDYPNHARAVAFVGARRAVPTRGGHDAARALAPPCRGRRALGQAIGVLRRLVFVHSSRLFRPCRPQHQPPFRAPSAAPRWGERVRVAPARSRGWRRSEMVARVRGQVEQKGARQRARNALFGEVGPCVGGARERGAVAPGRALESGAKRGDQAGTVLRASGRFRCRALRKSRNDGGRHRSRGNRAVHDGQPPPSRTVFRGRSVAT